MATSASTTRAARLAILLSIPTAVVTFAGPAAADPVVGTEPAPPPQTTQGALPETTPGIQSIATPNGDQFYFLPVDRSRRWFPFCPQGDPPNRSTDVCGGTGAGDRVYGGRTFFPDPDDSRCTVVAAHNDAVRPPDVVLPRTCYRLPLLFGVASASMLDQVAQVMRTAIGSCAGKPPSSDACGNPFTRWPRRGAAGLVDCAKVAPADLPPDVAGYTGNGQDAVRMGEVCATLNAYLGGSTDPPPPAAAALSLGSAAFDLYGRGAGSVPTQHLLDLGLFTLNVTEACRKGNSVACGLDKAAAAIDCARDPMECVSRWLANGATSAVRLLGEVIAAPPPVDLTDPAFRNLYQPLGIISAYLALLLLLVSGISSAVRLDYAGIGTAVLGVFRYALGLAVLLTLTATALDLAHSLSAGIAGDESSLQALTTRFQQNIQDSLTGTGGSSSAFIAVLSVLMLLAAAFTWLIMNGRKAGILVICAFSPILLAGQAGPQWARSWAPRAVKMLAAIIFAQPIAAVFYRLGVGLMGTSTGPGNVVTGLIILLLVGFAPWLLLAFIGITTQLLANEQTRARGGYGGAGLTTAAMAAATMRANSPAPLSASTPSDGAGTAQSAGTAAGSGRGRSFGQSLATGVLVASAAQQVAAHVGEQVSTAGGATGEAPRGPQLAYAASIGSRRHPTPSVAPQGAGAPGPPPVPPQPPPPPPEPEPEPIAAAAVLSAQPSEDNQ